MENRLRASKHGLMFVIAGLIAAVGFGSGDIAFGIAGLGLIALLAARRASKLARS
jgi:hypothetical protein